MAAPKTDSDLEYACGVVRAEADGVVGLLAQIDATFSRAVELLLACRGRVVVTGIGKAGLIGQKISATLASTGTPSLFLHAGEALHGDLGRVADGDVVLALSNSGETEELRRLLPALRRVGVPVVCITGAPDSPLARNADITLTIGKLPEACPMGLAPTVSTTAMLVLGDALAMTLARRRGFGRDDYAQRHPGGTLGRRLLRVGDVMRTGEGNPVVRASDALGTVIEVMTHTRGKPGAAVVIDEHGRLAGIFTDGDLRRLLMRRSFDYDQPVSAVMARLPKTVTPDVGLPDAERLLHEYQVDQLPVVDADGRPVGLLDVQDVLAPSAG